MNVVFVNRAYENMGIAALAAFIRRHGHAPSLVFDPAIFSAALRTTPFLARRFDISEKQVAQAVVERRPDVVAFSVYTDDSTWSLAVARFIRAALPSVPIVAGGPHASVAPQYLLEHGVFDACIRGEAEEAFLGVIESIQANGFIDPEIRNVSTLAPDGSIQHTPLRPYIGDLDALPFADKRLYYDKIPAMETSYSIMTARGCPYKCSFCYASNFHSAYENEVADRRHVRRRSVDNVIEELAYMKKRGRMKSVDFWDDVFTLAPAWLEEFSEKYPRQIGLPFTCFAHPNSLSQTKAEYLAAAGCFYVKMGVQSLNEYSLKELLDRQGNESEVTRAAQWLRNAGVDFLVDHILGIPGETLADQEHAVQFYIDMQPYRVQTFWLTYYPGTTIHEKVPLENRDFHKSAEAIAKGTPGNLMYHPVNDTERTKVIPAGMQLMFDLSYALPPRVARFLARWRLWKWIPYRMWMHKVVMLIHALIKGDPLAKYEIRYLFAKKTVP